MLYPNKSHSGEMLDSLFTILKLTKNENEAEAVEDMIWDIWMEGGSDEINTMMKRGCRFLRNENFDSAIRIFARMIQRNPEYPEAWNKRATAYYLRGDFKKAIDDIKQTLKLEPRHFGGLSGMASIYLVIGDHWAALKSLETLYTIRPNQPGLLEQINDLHLQLAKYKKRKE